MLQEKEKEKEEKAEKAAEIPESAEEKKTKAAETMEVEIKELLEGEKTIDICVELLATDVDVPVRQTRRVSQRRTVASRSKEKD